jgi:hypothetical protein
MFGIEINAHIIGKNSLLNITQTTQYSTSEVNLTSFSRGFCQEIVLLYFYQRIWKRHIKISYLNGLYVVKVSQNELLLW